MRSKVLSSGIATCLLLAGCTAQIGSAPTTGAAGSSGSAGTQGSAGTTGPGGSSASGGTTGAAGTTAAAGTTGAAGTTTGTAGTTGAAGTTAAGGRGGTTGTAGRGGTTGTAGKGGATGAAGTMGTAGTVGVDGGVTVDCTTTFPTGGNTYTGTNVNGMADGLNYGIWTNGSGGSITVFPSMHAFSASWANSMDFLAHVGLDFPGNKSYTAYGTVAAEFVETKTGTSGGFSSIGIYGWMHSPCVEWYINEDSFTNLAPRGSTTVMIDGAMYYLTTSMTSGTGGANACEAGHTGAWTNITSTRASAHQCGTVTVSDHFAAWAAAGFTVGNLASVHINVEVGGGTGSIQFPVANVTTTSK
jgi:hypothetical protein